MKIKGLEFTEFINEAEIEQKTRSLAGDVNAFYQGKSPVFLPVLNGSFMFASDLLKRITVDCKVSFVKVSSYDGLTSSGQFKTLIGMEESLFNQDVLIVEDVVDSGLTIQKLLTELKNLGARTVEVASLLRKKTAREKGISVRFIGFDIDNEFVLGYGLDYDGFGRNYPQLFRALRTKKG